MIKPKGKQFEIIDLPLDGHNVVLGSAGSGKSTCALIRANIIAEVKNEKVLLLTYNNSLVNYMNNIGFKNSNITITTYHKFVVGYLRKSGILNINGIVGGSTEKEKLICKAIELTVNQYGDNVIFNKESFIIEEISWMQKVGCLTLEEYETITRYGRGKGKLDRVNRKYIFYVYKNYISLREKKGYQYDWEDIAYYANKHIESKFDSREYKHIIIDEGQDFSPTMIKFLVNYVGEYGSIMYLGDAAQQIFGSNGTWISSGLVIRKAYKLEQNYRNTKQIEALANEIRRNIPLSEQEVKLSENSESNGELPQLVKADSENQEINYIINKANQLKTTGSVAIICATKNSCKYVERVFELKNINYLSIDRNQRSFSGQNVICIGTYHSLKGLEFDNVILYKCTDEGFDCSNLDSLDDDLKEELLNKISKLLYVGATRAKKNLIITYVDKLVRAFPKGANLYETVTI